MALGEAGEPLFDAWACVTKSGFPLSREGAVVKSAQTSPLVRAKAGNQFFSVYTSWPPQWSAKTKVGQGRHEFRIDRGDGVAPRHEAPQKRDFAPRPSRRARSAHRRGGRRGERASDLVPGSCAPTRRGARALGPDRARAPRRPARADQGFVERRGRAHHARIADLHRFRPRALRHRRRDDRGARRPGLCEVEHARVRRRRKHLQRGLRRDEEPA